MREQLIKLIVHHVIYKGWQFSLNVINFHRMEANNVRVAQCSTVKATLKQLTTTELNTELYNIMEAKYADVEQLRQLDMIEDSQAWFGINEAAMAD